MLVRQGFMTDPATGPGDMLPHTVVGDIAVVKNVQCGLNLHLKLKSPAQMPALLETINSVADLTHAALKGLHYVHFARFLPAWDGSALWVITVFDGAYKATDASDPAAADAAYNDSMQSYLMDFVAVLGPVFTAILEFVQDAPRLPVPDYPRDFIDFVVANNNPRVNPWSAYPEMTVIDIQSTSSIR